MGETQRKWMNEAGPRQTKAVNDAINNLFAEGRTYTELSGVIGKDEHTFNLMNLFGPCRQEVLDLHAKIQEAFNGWIRPDNYRSIVEAYERAREEAKKTRPVIDKRTTPEADQALKDQGKERQLKHEEECEEAERIISIRDPGRCVIDRDETQMFITIRAFFDDSDTISDYLNRHHQITKEYALSVVPSQARTESVARLIVSKIPELSALAWTWHIEEYSGGNGIYLKSKDVGEIKYQAYDGREQVPYWYEITFDKSDNHLAKSRFFLHSNGAAGSASPQKIITRNEARGGMEVKFSGKPDQIVIDYLKANGFHWSRRQSLWYRKYHAALFEEIEDRFPPVSD